MPWFQESKLIRLTLAAWFRFGLVSTPVYASRSRDSSSCDLLVQVTGGRFGCQHYICLRVPVTVVPPLICWSAGCYTIWIPASSGFTGITSFLFQQSDQSQWKGSNLQLALYRSAALPIELHRLASYLCHRRSIRVSARTASAHPISPPPAATARRHNNSSPLVVIPTLASHSHITILPLVSPV